MLDSIKKVQGRTRAQKLSSSHRSITAPHEFSSQSAECTDSKSISKGQACANDEVTGTNNLLWGEEQHD